MLYEIIERKSLFSSPSIPHLLSVIDSGFPVLFSSPHVSQHYQTLVRRCLSVNNRPTWSQLTTQDPHVTHMIKVLHQYLLLQQQKKGFIDSTRQELQERETSQLLTAIGDNLNRKLLQNLR